jgi:hypothetical protein
MCELLPEPMPLYRPPPKVWTLKLRSDESFRAEIMDIVRILQIHARVRGDDPEQVDISYVVRRMLETGRDQAFEEYGGRPKSESGWAALEERVAKSVKKH